VLPSAKYRPTRVVVDAALRRIGKSRHGGHKIANISRNCERIYKRFHQWIQRIFLVVVEAKNFFPKFFFRFENLDAIYCPVEGKPFVLEDLCLAWALLWHLP